MSDEGLRLLCLDGGGVRGLASLFLLKQLLGQVGDPKPCDYFDMICGTSTGGYGKSRYRTDLSVDNMLVLSQLCLGVWK
jgi:predicted acylesterase/phospholipase RssA